MCAPLKNKINKQIVKQFRAYCLHNHPVEDRVSEERVQIEKSVSFYWRCKMQDLKRDGNTLLYSLLLCFPDVLTSLGKGGKSFDALMIIYKLRVEVSRWAQLILKEHVDGEMDAAYEILSLVSNFGTLKEDVSYQVQYKTYFETIFNDDKLIPITLQNIGRYKSETYGDIIEKLVPCEHSFVLAFCYIYQKNLAYETINPDNSILSSRYRKNGEIIIDDTSLLNKRELIEKYEQTIISYVLTVKNTIESRRISHHNYYKHDYRADWKKIIMKSFW